MGKIILLFLGSVVCWPLFCDASRLCPLALESRYSDWKPVPSQNPTFRPDQAVVFFYSKVSRPWPGDPLSTFVILREDFYVVEGRVVEEPKGSEIKYSCWWVELLDGSVVPIPKIHVIEMRTGKTHDPSREQFDLKYSEFELVQQPDEPQTLHSLNGSTVAVFLTYSTGRTEEVTGILSSHGVTLTVSKNDLVRPVKVDAINAIRILPKNIPLTLIR